MSTTHRRPKQYRARWRMLPHGLSCRTHGRRKLQALMTPPAFHRKFAQARQASLPPRPRISRFHSTFAAGVATSARRVEHRAIEVRVGPHRRLENPDRPCKRADFVASVAERYGDGA